MSRDGGNDELREDRLEQEERRQTLRDESVQQPDGEPGAGSQDERRHEGDRRH